MSVNTCVFHRWVTGEWGSCSVTCGKGLQQRDVACVYQLQNGSFIHTRDLYCQGGKPPVLQVCEGRLCLTVWEASEWSKVRENQFWFYGVVSWNRLILEVSVSKCLGFRTQSETDLWKTYQNLTFRSNQIHSGVGLIRLSWIWTRVCSRFFKTKWTRADLCFLVHPQSHLTNLLNNSYSVFLSCSYDWTALNKNSFD